MAKKKKRVKKKETAPADKYIASLRKEVKYGNPEAMFLLAYEYDDGFRVPRNQQRAAELYEEAAVRGYEKAMHQVGRCYAFGLLGQQDFDKAAYWLNHAINYGVEDAKSDLEEMNNLKIMIADEKKEYDEVLERFQNGDQKAIRDIARFRFEGRGTLIDDEGTLEFLKNEADQGNIQAMIALYDYYYKEGHKPELGLSYIQKAAEQGDIEADYLWSTYLLENHQIDYELFLEKTLEAAKEHVVDACQHAFRMYYEGFYVDVDYDVAYNYLLECLKADYEDARDRLYQYIAQQKFTPEQIFNLVDIVPDKNDIERLYLGYFYLRGYGVEQDIKKALEYLRTGASGDSQVATYGRLIDRAQPIDALKDYALQQNDSTFMYLLGCHYFDGILCEKDTDEATKWFNQAAELGHAEAQSVLGEMYLRGWYIKQDEQKGLSMLEKAAQNGSTSAAWMLKLCFETGSYGCDINRQQSELYKDLYIHNRNEKFTQKLESHSEFISQLTKDKMGSK